MKRAFVLLCSLALTWASGCLSGLQVDSGDGGAGGSAGSSVDAGPACDEGFFCTGPLAEGWEGFVRAHIADYGAVPVPPCPDGSAPTVYYSEPAQNAVCDDCTCSYTGAVCTVPKMQCYWSNTNCGGNADYATNPDDTTCDPNLPAAAGASSHCVIVGQSNAVGKGTCTASPGAVKNPPFAQEIHLCPAQSVAECAIGGECVAQVEGDYASTICIHRANVEACPPGFEVEKQVFESGSDGRSCTDCQCDPNTVTCTGGGHDVFDLESCGGMKKFVTADLGCTGVGAYLDSGTGSIKGVRGTPVPGVCLQGQPSGWVEGVGARKLCCRTPG